MLGSYWLAKRIANQFYVKAIVILACVGGAGAALNRCWIADASVLDHVSNLYCKTVVRMTISKTN